MAKGERVAVIGLDGLPYRFPVIAGDAMPTLRMLARKGIHRILYSILPPYTPPAWTSIATGVNPGKHGVFDFHVIRKTEKGFVSRLATASDVRYPRLHDMLGLHRLKSIVFNLPLTYPPWAAGNRYSIVINDWMAPRIRIHPREIEEKFIHYFNKGLEALDLKGSSEESFKIMAERVSMISQGLLELMDKTDWSMLFTVFSETDWSMHGNKRVVRGDFTPYSREVFRRIDSFIKRVLDYTDNVIIVSDHGFTLCPYVINPGFILREHGLSSRQRFSDTLTIEVVGKRLRVPPVLVRLVRRHKRLKALMRRLLLRASPEAGAERRREIPYSLSKTIMPDAGIIYVAPGYVDRVEQLLKAADGVKAVYRPDKLYWGPHVGRAPDLIIEPALDYCIGTATDVYRWGETPLHCREGIIVARLSEEHSHIAGAIASRGRLELWDVAPIVLGVLGLPLPIDTDSSLAGVIGGRRIDYRARYAIARRLRTIGGVTG